MNRLNVYGCYNVWYKVIIRIINNRRDSDEYYHLKCYNKNKRKINENMILSDQDLQNECMYCKKILKEDIDMNTLIDSDDDTYVGWKSSIYIMNGNEYYHKNCYKIIKNKQNKK